MKTAFTVVGGVALAAALAFPLTARANILVNGSLETTLTPDQYDLVSASATSHPHAITGWTITQGAVDIVPDSYWQANLGIFSVDLIGSPGLGTISQSVNTTIGDIYELTFEFSVNPQTLTGEGDGTKNLLITATSSTLAIDGSETFDGTAGSRTLTNMEYVEDTFTFTATSTVTMLSLAATMPTGLPSSFNATNVFAGPVVDNLDLEDEGSSKRPVPEPASLALMGIGGVAFLRRRGPRV